jgi:hypothetical protein
MALPPSLLAYACHAVTYVYGYIEDMRNAYKILVREPEG